MNFYARMFAVVLLGGSLALAQHGTADQGYHRYGYRGDIWTGTVTSVDHDQGTITLEYEHKGKVENFTGTLKPPLQVLDVQGNQAKPPIHIQAGDRMTVYYVSQGLKYTTQVEGKRHDEVATDNWIFEIRFLPPKK